MFYLKDFTALFDGSIQMLSTRCYVRKKEEYVYLRAETSSGNFTVKEWASELGEIAADFLCDEQLNDVHNFLITTKDLVRSIKANPNDRSLWNPFIQFVYSCLDVRTLHPFYFPLITEIVNAYRTNMKDDSGQYFPDDYFAKYADSLACVHEHISNVTRLCFHRNSKSSTARALFVEHGFYQPVKISDVFFQLVSTPPTSPEEKPAPHPRLVLHPKTIEDMWNFLCAEYLSANILLIPCENCGRYFPATGRSNVKYCTRTFENTGRSCRDFMPEYMMRIKLDNSPAEKLFKSAYKTMYSRVTAGKYTKEQFKEWSGAARQMRNSCTAGLITFDEFVEWLRDSGL